MAGTVGLGPAEGQCRCPGGRGLREVRGGRRAGAGRGPFELLTGSPRPPPGSPARGPSRVSRAGDGGSPDGRRHPEGRFLKVFCFVCFYVFGLARKEGFVMILILDFCCGHFVRQLPPLTNVLSSGWIRRETVRPVVRRFLRQKHLPGPGIPFRPVRGGALPASARRGAVLVVTWVRLTVRASGGRALPGAGDHSEVPPLPESACLREIAPVRFGHLELGILLRG